jgi:CYTH domain/Sulfatase
LGLGRPPKKIRSIYFDTAEHDLHGAGISLRLRRQNGGWLQTVKADQHVDGGISNPIELEAPVDREEPDPTKIADKKIKRAVQRAATGKTLKPVFETVVQRTTRTIKAQGSDIELVVDEGEVRAGDQMDAARGETRNAIKSATSLGLASCSAFNCRRKLYRGEKGTAYEAGWRVPGIMWAPGKIPAGAVYHQMMSHMDVWPTTAAMVGLTPPPHDWVGNDGKAIYFDGIDNSDYVTGKAQHSARDSWVYIDGESLGAAQGHWRRPGGAVASDRLEDGLHREGHLAGPDAEPRRVGSALQPPPWTRSRNTTCSSTGLCRCAAQRTRRASMQARTTAGLYRFWMRR